MKEETEVKVHAKIYSEGFVEPLEQECTLKVQVKKVRKKLNNFIPDVEEFIRDQELPF